MDVEKVIIYGLMKEIIAERRELSQQYYDLKHRLDNIQQPTKQSNHTTPNSYKEESIAEQATKKFNIVSNNKRSNKVAFERIAGYVSEILKSSDTPMSSKKVYEKLIEEYQLRMKYENFRNNILPKINDSNNFSIEKAYRGYWQYNRRKV